MKKTFISKSVKDTKKIAKSLSSKLKDNVVILSGPLGSGKTEFVKGLAEALGIKDVIKSPSFSKMNWYNGMIHFDLFLLDNKLNMKQFNNLIEEYLGDNTVVIEWGEKLPQKALKSAIHITLSIKNDNTREIEVRY